MRRRTSTRAAAGLALAAVVLATTIPAGCARPDRSSYRPRSVDFYVEGGPSWYGGSGFSGVGGGPKLDSGDVRVGVSVHFDFTYADEWVKAKPDEAPE